MDKKVIKRKIAQRKDAISHCSGVVTNDNAVLWEFPETLEDFSKTKSEVFIKHNAEMVSDASAAYNSGLPYTVCTTRVGIHGSRLKIFIKKAFCKLVDIFLGWLINPIQRRQTQYNNYLLSISKSLIKTCEQQNNLIKELYCRTDILAQSNYDEEIEKISNQIVELRSLQNTLSYGKSGNGGPCNIDDKKIEYLLAKQNISYNPEMIDEELVDYFDFENIFRGDRSVIIQRQQRYAEYLKTPHKKGFVLDLGSGRGEILEILKNNNIKAIGVDCYKPFVDYCNENGYKAFLSDALTYLDACDNESLNGIVLSQVAEHLDTQYLYQLIRTGYKKLKPGCCFILETPNPEALCVYTDFYTDASHLKPVSPHTLKYIFEKNGYSEVNRISADYSVHPYSASMKKYVIDKCTDSEEKEFFEGVNQMLFGQRDFVIVARK